MRRVSIGCGLIIWFTFVLSPCILFTLASQGEIIISQGDLPEQQIRIWLIMEIDQRGLGISSTSTRDRDDGVRCLQTDIRYWFWQGSEPPLSYCQCFTQVNGEWTPVEFTSGVC
jgi:hypothetical protein